MDGFQSAAPAANIGSVGSTKFNQKQLTVLKVDNGFVINENYSYPNSSKIAIDFESMVVILKEYFEQQS